MNDSDFIAYENHRLTVANAELRKERDELEHRIKRLEEAGDALDARLGCGCMYCGPCRVCQSASENWDEAKEAKP